MNVIKSIIIAFSMFSKIPMPNVKWEKQNMKYTFCFLPFIGLLIGVVEIGWFKLAEYMQLNNIVFGAVATVIPVVVTGGIHIDGFMDTCDALGAHSSREKMIEILDDSRVGAFAMIGVILYFLVFFGAMTCFYNLRQVQMCMIVFFSSRALSAFVIVSTDTLKQSGLLYTFKNGTDKIVTGLFALVYILVSAGLFEMFNMLIGAVTVIVLFFTTLYFLGIIVKKFGGISGDLIGWFISMAELLAIVVIGIGGVL